MQRERDSAIAEKAIAIDEKNTIQIFVKCVSPAVRVDWQSSSMPRLLLLLTFALLTSAWIK